jgi:probable HAF family extracellular repeat protein
MNPIRPWRRSTRNGWTVSLNALALLSVLPGWLGSTPAVMAQGQAHGSARYNVVDCGPSLVRTLVNTPGLNKGGQLAIWHTTDGGSITGIVFQGQKTTMIAGKDKFSFVYPSDINDQGTVVGSLQMPQDLRFTRAFKWSGGKLQLLGGLGGSYDAATAINASGEVAGNAQTVTGAKHAVLWKDGTARDLGLLPRGDYSSARDINDLGDVVGEANAASNAKPHAFIWHQGRMRRLADLDGGSFCSAQAINNKGVVIGSCDTAEGTGHGVIWRAGHIEDLGALGADDDSPSTALDINAQDEVVGSSEITDGKLRAFLWKDGKMMDLNQAIPPQSGWLLLVASRINDRGEIAGRGLFQGAVHAFLLKPITMR